MMSKQYWILILPRKSKGSVSSDHCNQVPCLWSDIACAIFFYYEKEKVFVVISSLFGRWGLKFLNPFPWLLFWVGNFSDLNRLLLMQLLIDWMISKLLRVLHFFLLWHYKVLNSQVNSALKKFRLNKLHPFKLMSKWGDAQPKIFFRLKQKTIVHFLMNSSPLFQF